LKGSRGRADYEKGLAAHAAGKADEAAAALGRAVKADPKLAAAWLSLAVVEAARKNGAAARAAADRAIELGRSDGELSPEFLSDALSTRAAIRAAAGDAAGARFDEVQALDAAPADWPRAAELKLRLGRP
jgi:tetratricopeptide (TPR) repeat protein